MQKVLALSILFAVAAVPATDSAAKSTESLLPLDVRYRLVKRSLEIAAREKQILHLQEEIIKYRDDNLAEIKNQQAACGGEIAANASNELVCRTKAEDKK
jgi:hypothetical protein